eukprot:750887-Rhodomonas_salina.2
MSVDGVQHDASKRLRKSVKLAERKRGVEGRCSRTHTQSRVHQHTHNSALARAHTHTTARAHTHTHWSSMSEHARRCKHALCCLAELTS